MGVREIWIPTGIEARVDDVAHALSHGPQKTGPLDDVVRVRIRATAISARAALRAFALRAWINGVSLRQRNGMRARAKQLVRFAPQTLACLVAAAVDP